MAQEFDCSDPAELLTGVRSARVAIGRGELVVIPTDTVYGIAADAFSSVAVQRLLDAKGRGRQSPPPVLIPGISTLDAPRRGCPGRGSRPGGTVLARRTHRHPCRAILTLVGSRRDPRHRRAADAVEPRRTHSPR